MAESKYCTYCGSNTNQTLIVEQGRWEPREVAFKSEKDGLGEEAWTVCYFAEKVYKCDGCGHIHLYLKETGHPDTPFNRGEYQFPRKVLRPQPNWIKHIHIDLFELVGEIYGNYNADNRISFNICCRTLLDKLITDEIGDIGGFAKKLDEYSNQGFITKKQKEILGFLTESGNAAAHRGYKASGEVSEVLLDIVEHVLHESVLHKKAVKHASTIPPKK